MSFCFQQFSPQKAAFKAMTVFTEQDFSAGMEEEELELKKDMNWQRIKSIRLSGRGIQRASRKTVIKIIR